MTSLPVPPNVVPPIALDGPAVEPVSLVEMRAYLRLDDGAEDDLVAGLIAAARLAVEASAGRVLIESRWRLVLDAPAPGRSLPLRLSPIIAIEGVRTLDAAGAGSDLAPALYRLDGAADPPRLVLDEAFPFAAVPFAAFGAVPGPARRLAVAVRAGYGAAPDAVPAPLRQAVRLTVAHWFEHRGDGAGGPLPPDVERLVAPFRRARL